MPQVICPVHDGRHLVSRNIATFAEVKETGEFLYLKRSQCECGSYIWYEGYPNSAGITRYFYGDPNYMESSVDGNNRTIFKISKSKLFYGNPSDWQF